MKALLATFPRQARRFSLLLAVVAFLGTAAPCRADLIMTVASSTAPTGGTGTLEVTLSSTGGSYDIAAFSIKLLAPAGSGVTFTGVNTNTAAPYIFGTYQSDPSDPYGTATFNVDPTGNPFPNQSFIAADIDFASMSGVTVNPGDTFGLAHVSFAVAPGTPLGAVTVSLVDIGGGTSLSDSDGVAPAFGTVSGTLTVAPAAPVTTPEPATLGALGLIGAAGLGYIRRRLRGAPTAAAGF